MSVKTYLIIAPLLILFIISIFGFSYDTEIFTLESFFSFNNIYSWGGIIAVSLVVVILASVKVAGSGLDSVMVNKIFYLAIGASLWFFILGLANPILDLIWLKQYIIAFLSLPYFLGLFMISSGD